MNFKLLLNELNYKTAKVQLPKAVLKAQMLQSLIHMLHNEGFLPRRHGGTEILPLRHGDTEKNGRC